MKTRAPYFFELLMCAFGVYTSIQFVAYRTSYKGAVWGNVLGVNVFDPFDVLFFIIKSQSINSEILIQCLYIILTFALIGAFIIKVVSIILGRQSKVTQTHGTARWAGKKDIKNMGLKMGLGGVVLGEHPSLGKISHDGPEHILLNAPTRSGKGVGVVIPTLLSWPHSIFVLDIKKENWAITSGFRRKFSHVICFDPTSFDGAKWNPLLEVRKGISEVKDVQNIADILVDPEGGGGKRDHWQQTSHALLVASILHILYTEDDKTLAGVANFLANPDRGVLETLQVMKETNHVDGKPHPVIASAAQEMLNKSENELSGVLSTSMSYLTLYRDPIISRNISASDFKVDDLMNAEHPVSLYLVLPAGDIDRVMPLARLMINMACRRLTEASIGSGGSPHKHRLLMLLDEFPALGCMPFFKKALGFVAGYKIKCMLVCQSYNNIYEHYGAKNSIFDNCHIRMTMAPNDNDTALEISKSLGQTTVKRHQINITGKRLSPFLSNISVSDQETARNLLNPDEVQKLSDDEIIVMVAKNYPLKLNKIFYYKENIFTKRCIDSPKLSENSYIDSPGIVTHDWENIKPRETEEELLSKDFCNEELSSDIGTLGGSIFEIGSEESMEVGSACHNIDVANVEVTDAEVDMKSCAEDVERICVLGVGDS